MLSKEKALYQVKLILECLPNEEYQLIPKETIEYIENNCEYDNNITINSNLPLENQNIDEYAYNMLNEIVNQVENLEPKDYEIKSRILSNISMNPELDKLLNDKINEKAKLNIETENNRLSNTVEMLKKENSNIPKMKELMQEYKDVLKQKENEIISLKKDNENLYVAIRKIPKFIRKIFIKEYDLNLLDDKKI